MVSVEKKQIFIQQWTWVYSRLCFANQTVLPTKFANTAKSGVKKKTKTPVHEKQGKFGKVVFGFGYVKMTKWRIGCDVGSIVNFVKEIKVIKKNCICNLRQYLRLIWSKQFTDTRKILRVTCLSTLICLFCSTHGDWVRSKKVNYFRLLEINVFIVMQFTVWHEVMCCYSIVFRANTVLYKR